MSEKMSVDEVAWRIASTHWITTGQIADDIAAAIRKAVAARDAEWRDAVSEAVSCVPGPELRRLMEPTRETPTPESKLVP